MVRPGAGRNPISRKRRLADPRRITHVSGHLEANRSGRIGAAPAAPRLCGPPPKDVARDEGADPRIGRERLTGAASPSADNAGMDDVIAGSVEGEAPGRFSQFRRGFIMM